MSYQKFCEHHVKCQHLNGHECNIKLKGCQRDEEFKTMVALLEKVKEGNDALERKLTMTRKAWLALQYHITLTIDNIPLFKALDEAMR